ncbi:uncharacterized protein LOC133721948 [Rosa rugosa]|uniref:uncharacterized protein LOC133721948 n=1 Tax=Rosa rugosa TaxID=74645 RepID=UPI002B40A7B0|nr:uncharacterized protein LOC133721948 [Rosa rugosa]
MNSAGSSRADIVKDNFAPACVSCLDTWRTAQSYRVFATSIHREVERETAKRTEIGEEEGRIYQGQGRWLFVNFAEWNSREELVGESLGWVSCQGFDCIQL